MQRGAFDAVDDCDVAKVSVAMHDHVTGNWFVAGAVGVGAETCVLATDRIVVHVLRSGTCLRPEPEPREPALGGVQAVDQLDTLPAEAVDRRVGLEIVNLAVVVGAACALGLVCAIGAHIDALATEPVLTGHLDVAAAAGAAPDTGAGLSPKPPHHGRREDRKS